ARDPAGPRSRRAGSAMNPCRAACLLALALLVGGPGGAAAPAFHRWVDADGRPRVSNVPPPGVRTDGTLRPAWHPNSIAVQHRRLRDDLARRDAELARRAGALEPVPGAADAAE
ncbi:MAG: DUF4124 domain-containing protein, partial [Gammaproteobacteria bacterium]